MVSHDNSFTPTPDHHARHVALLSIRAAIATHCSNLAVLAEGLGDAFLRIPHDRDTLNRIGTAADVTMRALVDLVGAERHIAPAGV